METQVQNPLRNVNEVRYKSKVISQHRNTLKHGSLAEGQLQVTKVTFDKKVPRACLDNSINVKYNFTFLSATWFRHNEKHGYN